MNEFSSAMQPWISCALIMAVSTSLHGQGRFAFGEGRSREPVGHRQDAAEIVGGVAPLGRQPGVVEVEPADHGADVERGLHGVELIVRARNARAVGDDGARHDGSQELGAGRILERLEAAAKRVDQAGARGRVGQFALDLVVQRVIGDVGEDFVGCGAFVADVRGHTGSTIRLHLF